VQQRACEYLSLFQTDKNHIRGALLEQMPALQRGGEMPPMPQPGDEAAQQVNFHSEGANAQSEGVN
jgi:hypothetical protein